MLLHGSEFCLMWIHVRLSCWQLASSCRQAAGTLPAGKSDAVPCQTGLTTPPKDLSWRDSPGLARKAGAETLCRSNSPLGLEGVSGGHYSQATGLRPEHNPPTLHQRLLKQQFAKFMNFFSSSFMKIHLASSVGSLRSVVVVLLACC